MSIVKVSGAAIGILVEGEFFPVVVDIQGSLVAVLNPQGSELIFEPHYDAWGNKTVSFGDNLNGAKKLERSQQLSKITAAQFEKSIPRGYANLLEFGWLFEKAQDPQARNLYWSRTRTYSPSIGEWLSADSAVKWNPEKISHHPSNWYAIRYLDNQPLDYVDPSGD
jgi:RHS repeat-associated protein